MPEPFAPLRAFLLLAKLLQSVGAMWEASPRGGVGHLEGAPFADVPSTSGNPVVPLQTSAAPVFHCDDITKPWNAPQPSASFRFKVEWMFVPAVIAWVWSVRSCVDNMERTMLTNGRVYERWDNGTGFRCVARDIHVSRNVCGGHFLGMAPSNCNHLRNFVLNSTPGIALVP